MKKEGKRLSQIAYWCFYIAVILEVMLVIIDKSDFTNPIEGRLFQLTFLLFFIKVLLTRYTWKEYAILLLFGILGAVSYFVTGRNEIVRLVMMIGACKGIDMRKCLKLVFFMTLAGCGALVMLSVTGIYGNLSLTLDFGRGGVETRYVLGMGHPNALQCMIWALTTLFLYLYGENLKWYYYLLLALGNVGFFLLTDSKTSLLVSLFIIAMVFCMTRLKREGSAKLRNAGMLIMCSLTVFSIGISVLIAKKAYLVYNHDWYETSDPETMFYVKLNSILTGRIRSLTGTTGWEGTMPTWSLFSRPENNSFFDMGWIRLFYWYGVIPGCIFVAVVLILLIYFYRKKDYMSIALITAISLYNIAEAHVISDYLARNYLFFLIGGVWCDVIKGYRSWRMPKGTERKDISWNNG